MNKLSLSLVFVLAILALTAFASAKTIINGAVYQLNGNVVDETVPEPVVIDLDIGASEPVVFVSYPTDPTESPTYYIDNGSSSDATVTIDDSGA